MAKQYFSFDMVPNNRSLQRPSELVVQVSLDSVFLQYLWISMLGIMRAKNIRQYYWKIL